MLLVQKTLAERYPDLQDTDLLFSSEMKDEKKGGKSEGLTSGDNYAFAKDQKFKDSTPAEGEEQNIWEIWAWLLKVKHEDWVIVKDPETGLDKAEPMTVEKGDDPEQMAEALGGIYWPREREKRRETRTSRRW